MIASLQDWWALAGVDLDYGEEPVALLEKVTSPKAPAPAAQYVSDQTEQKKPSESAGKQDYPCEIEAFLDWLRKPENLIEAKWAREFVLPEGRVESEIMLISAMPEGKSQASIDHFTPNSHQLVQNMVKALGSELAQCFHSPLALGRPVDGQIADQYMAALLDRALHLISLVRPKRIILFGDTVSRVFFKEDLLTARKKKQFINHVSSKTEAIVTFHPRILLERPELKAEAWKDLQLLTRIATQ